MVLVTPDGDYVDERGQVLDPATIGPTYRCFVLWDVCRQLVRAGRGESLCWNGEDVRWRPVQRPDERDTWVARSSDAYVLKWPFDEETLPLPELLGELARYRDWLAEHGAAPTGTTGSASMSLLRGRLETDLITSMGTRPPLLQTRGGRQEVGPAGPGSFTGGIVNFDLPSAYASTLGMVRYGGVWSTADQLPQRWQVYADAGLPVFVKAKVRVPDLPYGPLIRRLQKRVHPMQMLVYSSTREPDGTSWLYPTRRRIQGIWTWQEIVTAERHGATIERIIEVYVHRSGWQPFAPWWAAIQKGRELGNVAGAFAKMTGNALWGRFAMDPRVQGRRTISRLGPRGRMVKVELRQNPFQWPAHDLAETVAGRVRAELYDAMMIAGPRMLSAHTDGLWCRSTGDDEIALRLDGWRAKQKAVRLDLLDPQTLRYFHWRNGEPQHVMAGVPFLEAPAAFQRRWQLFTERAAA